MARSSGRFHAVRLLDYVIILLHLGGLFWVLLHLLDIGKSADAFPACPGNDIFSFLSYHIAQAIPASYNLACYNILRGGVPILLALSVLFLLRRKLEGRRPIFPKLFRFESLLRSSCGVILCALVGLVVFTFLGQAPARRSSHKPLAKQLEKRLAKSFPNAGIIVYELKMEHVKGKVYKGTAKTLITRHAYHENDKEHTLEFEALLNNGGKKIYRWRAASPVMLLPYVKAEYDTRQRLDAIQFLKDAAK